MNPLSPRSVRDQIALASNPRALTRPAFRVIDGLQLSQAAPGNQVLGCAAALLAMCEANAIPPADVLRKAELMLNDASRYAPQIQAIRDYALHHLNGR